MQKSLLAVALLAAFGASTSALADVSANIGVASEYSYRGISQSDNKPALSGGVDYSHASGLYLGTWASTISWLEDGGVYTDSKVEVDLYGGYKTEILPETTIDVGVLRYLYPGDKVAGAVHPNTTEVYGALNYKMVGVKYSHSTTNLFGFADSEGSSYVDLYGNFDIPFGMQLNLHAGKQLVENNNLADYVDYKIGVTKDFGFATGSLAYIKTTGDATDGAKNTPFEDWFEGRVVGTLTKSF